MSFAFNVTGENKAAALSAIAVQMDEVCKTQPAHERDNPLVMQVSEMYLDQLDEVPEGQQISASINGSVSWAYNPGALAPAEGQKLTGANLGVGVWFTTK